MHQPVPKQILIVDDDHIMSILLRHCLKGIGADLAVVKTGAEAVEFITAHPTDLVIMDYSMPGLSGIEAIYAIRQMKCGSDIPIIMLTGTDQTNVRREATELGVQAYLTKPFSPISLISHVGVLLRSDLSEAAGRLRGVQCGPQA